MDLETRESELTLAWIDDKEIFSDGLRIAYNFLLYAIRRKNHL